jgi:hypothetical protein
VRTGFNLDQFSKGQDGQIVDHSPAQKVGELMVNAQGR